VKQVLQKTTVDVVAVFGSGSLTIREFLNLRVGDVIALDQEVDAPSSLRVGGHTKFLARPGLAGRRRAVQVLDHAAERTAEPQEGAA
jgi:flagellar motor switch protein FliM